ncbi:MAG: glycosyltransferase family 9 protein [Gammaproteobacteria bacterium]
MTDSEIKTILFITLSYVGDAIMSTPVLEALHQRYPQATIDIVGDRRSTLLFSQCPYLGKIYHKDKQQFLRGSVALLQQVRHTTYDLIVDIRTDGLSWLMKGRHRMTKLRARPYGKHAVEEFMGVIHRLHGDRPIPPTRVWYGEREKDYARQALSELDTTRLLLVAPGAGTKPEVKCWGTDNFAAFCNALSNHFTAVALIGVKFEQDLTTAITHQLHLPYTDLAGDNNLLEVAALCERACFFVGNDSGLGHLAAATGTPVLTLFGSHSPKRVRPWGKNTLHLTSQNRRASSILVSDAVALVTNSGLV